MPETTETHHRIPNPNFSGEAFEDEGTRTGTISDEKGIEALYAPLKSSGEYKVRTFLFRLTQWPSMGAAEAWVREHRESFQSVGIPQETVVTCDVVFPEQDPDGRPTADELDLINSHFTLRPLTADDVYVRTSRLTNDQWSKNHVIRLARGFQRGLMQTLPGKSLLMGHEAFHMGKATPLGRWFDAREWRDDDTGIAWGMAKFYLVRDASEHMIKQLDGGVYSQLSIGMATGQKICSICGRDILETGCSHIPGEVYDAKDVVDADLRPEPVPDQPDKVYCGMIFRGQGRALEGSIVYESELHDTKVFAEAALAARAGDFADAKRLMLAAAAETDEASGQVLTTDAPGAGDAHTDVAQSGTAEGTVTDNGGDLMGEDTAALEAAKTAAEERVTTLEAEITEIKTAQEAQTAEVESLKAATADVAVLRAARVQEVERLAGLVGRETELAAFKSAFGEDLSAMPVDKLLALEADWTKTFDEATPPGGNRQSTDTERDEGTGDKVVADAAPVTLRHIG